MSCESWGRGRGEKRGIEGSVLFFIIISLQLGVLIIFKMFLDVLQERSIIATQSLSCPENLK